MALTPGTRLGPYEVVAQIGAGGMGEVYKATDTNLKRAVAIKVLPALVASDAERLARFQREAEVLAALNHPNIAAIYGLERSGGLTALVMELVDGPTLADRIAQGAIPVDEAIPIAKQIAEGVEAAHERGIIHRDLKPANVKVRGDGMVKVLDFGLAKMLEGDAAGSDVSQSPTLSVAATRAGAILGTAAYMSPEQARGKAVDKRTDIWAFGCVLYEMLTGVRAFGGEDATLVIANVVKSEPDWTLLPANASTVRTILRGCLEKDQKRRIRDIGDVGLALEGAFLVPVEPPTARAVAARIPWSRRALPWLAGLLVGGVLSGLAAWAIRTRAEPPAAAVRRFAITLPEGEELPAGSGTLVGVSPDGQTLVYRARRDRVFRLYGRDFGQLEVTPVGEPNAGAYVFFSADSRWIGYIVGNTLKKVPASGGQPQRIGDLEASTEGALSTFRGAHWSDDGDIVVASGTRLLRIPSAGGTAEPLTVDQTRQVWYPQILPGGVVLFTSNEGNPDSGRIEILRLDTGARRTLLAGSGGRYIPTGHLLFARANTLWAVRFDLGRLELVGTPVPVVEGVRVEVGGAVQFAVAEDGSLVYIAGGIAASPRRLLWVDRDGREEIIDAPLRSYDHPRISPDGTRVAVEVRDQDNDIWVWDFGRSTLTRVTFGPGIDQYPAWTPPDGRRIVFSSPRNNAAVRFGQPVDAVPFWQNADGTGTPESLAATPERLDQASISRDGKRLVLRAVTEMGEDIVVMELDGERRIEPLLATPFRERNPTLSPDGRWIAYQSDESGSFEIYFRPFPDINSGKWQISSGGGSDPVWRADGRELSYIRNSSIMMVVAIDTRERFNAGTAVRLFDASAYTSSLGRDGTNYDVSPDGRRFLMVKDVETGGASPSIVVVQNWLEELKRLVPAN